MMEHGEVQSLPLRTREIFSLINSVKQNRVKSYLDIIESVEKNK